MDLRTALDELDFIEKVVLLKHFWEGKSMDEISSLLKKETNAVKQIHHRSINKLRKQLSDYLKESE